MRAPAEVRLERFRKLMDSISYETERGGVIVVEGLRDRESLRKMGISGRILCLQSSRKNAVGFVEGLQGVRDVVVLTDFDREGVFLAKRLVRILTSQNVHANLVLWRELRQLTRSDVRSIEELPKYYQRMRVESAEIRPSWDRAYEPSRFDKGRWPPISKTHRRTRRSR